MDFRIIKAHDGLRVGDIKVLDAGDPVAAYMVDKGFWEPVTAPEAKPAAVETKPVKKKKRR